MPILEEAPVLRHAATPAASRFYTRVGIVCLATAVFVFTSTCWLPLLRGSLDASPVIHAHALVFYA